MSYSIDNRGGILNFRSRLDHVNQSISQADLSGHARDEFAALVKEFADQLAASPASVAEDRERAMVQIEHVGQELARKKPSRRILELSLEGLKEAAAALKMVAPTLIPIAERIASFVLSHSTK